MKSEEFADFDKDISVRNLIRVLRIFDGELREDWKVAKLELLRADGASVIIDNVEHEIIKLIKAKANQERA